MRKALCALLLCVVAVSLHAADPLSAPNPDTAFADCTAIYLNTHTHTSLSDATGPGSEPGDVVAANQKTLDGLVLTDHGEHLTEEEWAGERLLATRSTQGGKLCLRGFEVTGTDDLTQFTAKNPAYQHGWGHLIVLNTDTFCGRKRFGNGNPPTFVRTYWEFLDWLGAQAGGMAVFAHPSLYMEEESFGGFAAPRNQRDIDHIVGCELYSHGLDLGDKGLGNGRELRSSNEACFRELLRKGWRVSPYNGGDRHLLPFGGVPTVTGCYVTNRSPSAVIEAMAARRTFATEQPGASIRFVASHGDRSVRMGETLAVSTANTADDVCFHAACVWPQGTVRTISLVFVGKSTVADFEQTSHRLQGASEHWGMLVSYKDWQARPVVCVYAKALLGNGKHAVSAPIWFSTRP